MMIDNLLSLMQADKLVFRESRQPAPDSLISQNAKDQILLILPLINQLLWVYEYDGDVVEIAAQSLYLVTSKDKGERLGMLEERLQRIVTGLS